MKNLLLQKINMQGIRNNRGFTIIELLLIMALASILIGLVTINLLKVQHNTSVYTAADTLVTDMKGQQVKAMNGAILGASSDSYGISFQSNKYVLFHGTTYNDSDTTNFSVALDSGVSVTSTFPLVTGYSAVIFSQLSGQVAGFTVGKNTITIKHISGPEQAIITVNQYGVVTQIQ